MEVQSRKNMNAAVCVCALEKEMGDVKEDLSSCIVVIASDGRSASQ